MQLRFSLNRTKILGFPLAFIGLFPIPAAFAGDELFRDDFSSGLKSHWAVAGQAAAAPPAAWQASGGVLLQTGNIGGLAQDPSANPGPFVLAGDAGWTDYDLAVRLRSPAAGGVGLVFGYRDALNYYGFSISAESATRANRRLLKVVNGLVTVLDQDTGVFEAAKWYSVAAKLAQGLVEIRIDGRQVFKVADVSHNAGKIGLYSFGNSSAAFDDVVVTRAATTAPALEQDALLADNFDGTLLQSLWAPVDEASGGVSSDWRLAGGFLNQTSSIANTYLVAGDAAWTGYSVNVEMRTPAQGLIGLIFGYQDAGNYYRLVMGTDPSATQLMKVVGGVITRVDQGDITYPAGAWHAVEARLSSSNLEIWIDHTRVFQKQDPSVSSGKIALYSASNPGAQFDNLLVMPSASACHYSILPSAANVGAAGTTGGALSVAAPFGCDWTASSNNPDWLSVTSGSNGTGTQAVAYKVQPNNTLTARTGTLAVAGQTFTVTQDAAACTYTIAPLQKTFNPGASTGQVTVTTLTGCSWSAVSNAPWLVITSGKAGTASGKVNYSVKANGSGVVRQGTMTIAGQTFLVAQSSQNNCKFTVTPTVITLSPNATTTSISVATTVGCSWSSVSNTPWLSVTSAKSLTGNGKTTISVEANSGADARVGSLTVAGANVQVTQFAAGVPNVHYVPSGGDLQLAIDQALPGDTILLQPGVTYKGTFIFRNKSGNQFITITTADAGSLPPDQTRITPAFSSVLPKVVSPSNSPVFRTDDGAHHYRLVGLEIQAPGWYNWDLIRLGSDVVTDVSMQAANFELDRLYIHGDPKLGAKRGVTLNSVATTIKNCYISDIKGIGQETQAIGGWNGPGPYQITNNYLEAAGENIMFGGAPAAIPGLVPSDITITHNHLNKQTSWKKGEPNYAGKLWTVKNLLELKNASRVLVEGNVFENNWLQAQNGYAIVMTVRTQSGVMPWAVVEDITFVHNIVRHSGAGVNILGKDDNGMNLGIARRLLIKDNLFEDIDYKRWGGDGRLFQVLRGAEDVTVDHNTVVSNNTKMALSLGGLQLVRFVFTNNILAHGASGVVGTGTVTPNAALNRYAPGYVFARNALVAGGKAVNFPPSNFFPASYSAVGFTNLAAGDYHLDEASPYFRAATDGGSLGADADAVITATTGAVLH